MNAASASRTEWLERRRQGIGGSDAAAIVGLNPFKSAFEVYAEKVGVAPDREDNEAMRQGRDLEEYVAARFTEATGKKVRRKSAMLRGAEYPFMLANVDRMLTGSLIGLECKTTGAFSLKRFKNGDYPPEYYCQCVHYMAVTGAPMWYLAVLHLGRGFEVYEIQRDEAEIKALAEAEREFWERHVIPRVPPEPDGGERCGEIIGGWFGGETVKDGTVDLGGFQGEIDRYVSLTAQIAALEKERGIAKQKLQMELGDAVRGETDSHAVHWKPVESERIDTKRLRAQYPNIAALVSRPGITRRFEIQSKNRE
jgi:putative phage-type endonuclease